MPIIRSHRGVVTQINVFTTTAENQQSLIDLLVEAAQFVRDVPGWMSASIHQERGGTRVVNYAQCESHEAWQAVMSKLQQGNFFERNKLLGVASPGLYEVVATLDRRPGAEAKDDEGA
jgi:antibiotic biosynthesis monooxygenase (ABM) superfamily enzyme